MRFIFLIFIIVPLAEMLLLFEVAERIGGWSTLGLVVLTAVIGIQILKQQGLATLTRANQRIGSGELPAQEMLEGLFLAVGGAFLLTPGFITDTLGFLFLIRPTRRLLVQWLIRSGKLAVWQAGSQQGFYYKVIRSNQVHLLAAAISMRQITIRSLMKMISGVCTDKKIKKNHFLPLKLLQATPSRGFKSSLKACLLCKLLICKDLRQLTRKIKGHLRTINTS